MKPEDSQEMTMVCAWCARVLVQGTSGEISHGICDDCLPGVVSEILEKLKREEQANGDGEAKRGEEEQDR